MGYSLDNASPASRGDSTEFSAPTLVFGNSEFERESETRTTEAMETDSTVLGGSRQTDSDTRLASSVSLLNDPLRIFDNKFNTLGPLDKKPEDSESGEKPTETTRPSESKPEPKSNRLDLLGVGDLDSIGTFFVLDKQEGAKHTPPVDLIDKSKPQRLEITDGSGRVIADESARRTAEVKRDESTGEVETIQYPDGKVRNFQHQNGELARIETLERDAGGKVDRTVFVKNPSTNKWYAEISGLQAELPGDIQLSKDGVLSFQLDEGKWRSERPDGSVVTERTNRSGARVAFNKDNSIQQITRKDNSRVECTHEDGHLSQVKELDPQGNTTTWTKQAGKWVSDGQPPREMTDISVHENGNISFKRADNTTETITGAGVRLEQRADGSACEFDDQGRFTQLKLANGLRVNGIQYNEADRVSQVQMTRSRDGITFTYRRIGNSNTWAYSETDSSGKVVKQDQWHGDINIDEQGNYSYLEGNQHGRNQEGFWTVFGLDGSHQLHRKDNQGSLAVFDANKNLLGIERANGTKLEVNRRNGLITDFRDTDSDGRQVHYIFDPTTRQYLPDKPGAKAIKQLEFGTDGSLKITDVNGSEHAVRLDGSATVENADGSQSEVDSHGRVVKTVSKKGDVNRTFNYEGDKLVSVQESRNNGDQIERRTITGKELSADNSGTIRFIDGEGQRLATTADGSWQALDGNGLVVRTVDPKGNSRSFERDDQGEVTKIIDERRTSKKVKVEEWSRVKENGRWTDTFARVKSDGKIDARHGVQILDTGNYNYIDNNGKDKLAKVGGRSWEIGGPIDSADIEDARDSFNEVMESSFNNPERLARLHTLMKKFEERMSERLECRILAGDDPEKTGEEIEKKIASTYANLTEMVSMEATGDSAFQSADMRATLAEHFIFHAHDTTKMNQGSNGTCWIHAGHILAMANHPDHMARFVKEITLKGEFTTLNNGESDSTPKTVKFSKGLFNYRQRDEEAQWSVDSPYQNGRRGPIALIFDQALPILTGRTWGSNAGNYGGRHGVRKSIYMVTGDAMPDRSNLYQNSERLTFLKYGGMIRYAPGHMATRQLIKRDGDWYVLRDDQHGPHGDRIEYKVSDLKNWTKERAGRVRTDKPWTQNIDGDTTDAIYFPGGGNRPGDRNPGGWRPRRPFIRRIFRWR